jgi:hypothetical protein
MKFICLGYGEEKSWDAKSAGERDTAIEECFRYDDELLKDGHWQDGGQALQGTRTAKTLRWESGKVVVTDGPFAETKEQLGGIGVLEAQDMDHAIELILKHPTIRLGPIEIRPVDEEMFQRNQALDAKYRNHAAAASSANADAVKFAAIGYGCVAARNSSDTSASDAMLEECIAFDVARRKAGQWLGGIKLQGVETAKTLRTIGGKVIVTDGPFAETKEQLGGVVVLGLTDMNRAIELLRNHPALRYGVTIEVRPIDEALNKRWEARQNRIKNDANRRSEIPVA